ncbi:hypothetical protein M2117_000054 [Aurantimicrobium minutum]|nr:hypothetical protein [Aurantimicrobium minutum]
MTQVYSPGPIFSRPEAERKLKIKPGLAIAGPGLSVELG